MIQRHLLDLKKNTQAKMVYRILEIGPNSTYKSRHYSTYSPTDILINKQGKSLHICHGKPDQTQKCGLLGTETFDSTQSSNGTTISRAKEANSSTTAEKQYQYTTSNATAKQQQHKQEKQLRSEPVLKQKIGEIQLRTTSANQLQLNTQWKVEKVADFKLANEVR